MAQGKTSCSGPFVGQTEAVRKLVNVHPLLWSQRMSDHDQPFDQGLQHDLKVLNALANRRRVLTWIAAAGAGAALIGCSGSSSDDSATGGSAGTGAGGTGAGGTGAAGTSAGGTANSDDCTTIPEETGGP